jgi:DNA-directed RNA polymerase subunit RPC12/RpoP
MKCPGQDLQYWKPGAIYEAECPRCGRAVEFFKDDTARTCPGCRHRFVNPKMDFGCAAYCPFAEQCLGTLPEGAAIQREALLKDRVAVEMKRRFGNDFKRIGRSSRVARHAERIGREEAGPLAVILPAAFLHELPAEPDGTAPAQGILQRLGARAELIAEVCDALARIQRPPAADDPPGVRVLRDAHRLDELEERRKAGEAAGIDETDFQTEAGRRMAAELLRPDLA